LGEVYLGLGIGEEGFSVGPIGEAARFILGLSLEVSPFGGGKATLSSRISRLGALPAEVCTLNAAEHRLPLLKLINLSRSEISLRTHHLSPPTEILKNRKGKDHGNGLVEVFSDLSPEGIRLPNKLEGLGIKPDIAGV
jgi:hypothetical protein